ncbi:hypothetical protein [Luteibacter sp. SG786]|uniref:hypothetical protein n=1 Tax=Luteibacter sp. SG786 TaxID=2587130 RepID=UPI00142243EC|nr:hypothetical protein [Luteibacter sp. SG786]NII54385.1 hypothetical protein [Luteibacter sp. SG786]
MTDAPDLETMGYIIAATCLEPKSRRVIRPHVRPNRTVHRQIDRKPQPIGQFNEEGDMGPLAKFILRRIRKNRHVTGAGSYLMGDEHKQVYVVAEGSSTGMVFVNRHESWHIGRYGAGIRGALPMVEQLIGDMQEHFRMVAATEVQA